MEEKDLLYILRQFKDRLRNLESWSGQDADYDYKLEALLYKDEEEDLG